MGSRSAHQHDVACVGCPGAAPDWLAQGLGYFLATASAAGLLTNLEATSPYSVSKAGAVAFADWMSATYGDRNQGFLPVPARRAYAAALGPEDGDGLPTDGVSGSPLAAEVVKAQRIIEPSDVAQCVYRLDRQRTLLILPHEEVAKYMVHKATIEIDG